MKSSFFFIVLCFAGSAAAATLTAENTGQFFVTPETQVVLRFALSGDEPLPSGETLVRSVTGEPAVHKTSMDVEGQTVSVTGTFPQGFWELGFPNGQTFGIVSLPAFEGTRDNFFAIDGALSWLVDDDKVREELVQAARRCGITMIRERVRWGDIEKKEGTFDWQTHRRYEKIRQYCQTQGISVLELFHDAPDWTEKIEKYPGNLNKTVKSWQTIGERWKTTWGALELWNEPEISFGAELPADQYVPIVKALAFSYEQRTDVSVPLFGGVMAHFQKRWLRTAAENGLLDAIDGFSFHTYGTACSIEKLAADYRNYLTEFSHESMPLWLTESGRPWKRGTDRPSAAQDSISAVDIVMKGVESRCCGIERYFPFVYPYYEENDNNFGMMDKAGSPCRSMAAYVQMIHALSGTEYIGDWKTSEPAIVRARLFQNERNENIAVLYTDALDKALPYKIPGNVKRLESFTGEPLTLKDGALTLESTQLYYVYFDGNVPHNLIEKETAAMKLYQAAHRPLPSERPAQNPLVMRFEYDSAVFTTSPDGYIVTKNPKQVLPLKIRLFNFDSQQQSGTLHLAEQKTAFNTAAQNCSDIVFNVPVEQLNLESGEWTQVNVTAKPSHTPHPVTLSFMMRGQTTWDGAVSAAQRVTELPVNELSRWQKNAPNYCDLAMEGPADGISWRMTAKFQGNGDRWVYPRFQLPPETDLTKYSGVLAEIRCFGDVTPRCFLFEKSGAGYITDLAVKGGGEWAVVKLPFDVFSYTPSTQTDENEQLDLNEVPFISFGANSRQNDCKIEIKRAALYQDKNR